MKMLNQVELKMPWLVPEVASAVVIKWLVAEGERVVIDQDLLELECDGDIVLLPSPEDGIIRSFFVTPGDAVNPDDLLAVIERVGQSGGK